MSRRDEETRQYDKLEKAITETLAPVIEQAINENPVISTETQLTSFIVELAAKAAAAVIIAFERGYRFESEFRMEK